MTKNKEPKRNRCQGYQNTKNKKSNLVSNVTSYLEEKLTNIENIKINARVGFLLLIIAYSIYYGAKLINQIIDYNFGIEIKVVLFILTMVIVYIFILIRAILPKIINEYIITIALLITALIKFNERYQYKMPEIITIILPIIYFSCYLLFTKYDKSKKQTLWALFTITIILFSFIAGLMMLNAIYGYNKISLHLNIDGDTSKRFADDRGIIECYPDNDKNWKIFASSNVSCNISPNVEIINATLTTYSKFRVPSLYDFKNMKFTANENITRIQFELNVKTPENQTYNLKTSEDHVFYTYEEYISRKEKLTSYIIGLAIIVLFSIPSMMVHFRELSKE